MYMAYLYLKNAYLNYDDVDKMVCFMGFLRTITAIEPLSM